MFLCVPIRIRQAVQAGFHQSDIPTCPGNILSRLYPLFRSDIIINFHRRKSSHWDGIRWNAGGAIHYARVHLAST